ncbi:MAG: hypothetical protein QW346_02800 [Candidatus Micrarchaeaceae archaeon]
MEAGEKKIEENVAQFGNHKKLAAGAIVIIIAVAVVAIAIYSMYGKALHTTTVTTTSIKTSASTSTSASTTSTTILPQFNFTQNVTINTLAINKTNVLFGIPDKSQFEALFNATSVGNYSSSIYGLNFTTPIMTGAAETNFTYNPAIPAVYENVTYPVAIYVTIATYNTMPEALKAFDSSYGPGNSFVNGTYYINASGYLSRNPNESYVLATMIRQYPINIGNIGTVVDVYPIYHLDNYLLVYVYKRNMVFINSYGIPGKFNYTYVNNIAKHLENVFITGK